MKLISTLLALLLLLYAIPATAQDSTGAADETFSMRVRTGTPQKILDNQVEVSLTINMFGRAELSFQGIVGVQLEPTSEFRHQSVNNIGRGDKLYMKINDSTLYLLRIANLWNDAIEIEFSRLPKTFIADAARAAAASNATAFVPAGGGLKGRLVVYGVGSFPLGEFRETDLTKSTSGFAEFGVGAGVGYSHQLNPHAEVGGVLLYTHNNLNEAMVTYGIMGDYPSAEINIKAWDLIWVLGEGGFTGDILQTLNYYVRGSLGMVAGYAPDVTAVTNNVAKSYLVGSCTTFAYGIAAGFRESEKIDLGMRFLNASGTFAKTNQSSAHNLMNIQVVLGFIL